MVGVALALALLEEVVPSLGLMPFAEIWLLVLIVPGCGLDLKVSQSDNIDKQDVLGRWSQLVTELSFNRPHSAVHSSGSSSTKLIICATRISIVDSDG